MEKGKKVDERALGKWTIYAELDTRGGNEGPDFTEDGDCEPAQLDEASNAHMWLSPVLGVQGP